MQKPSTENLNLIPKPIELQNLCKSISAIEAIISPLWEYRYYSYQKDWSETEEFCEMRNGQGDQMLILFRNDGICINGFASESEMNGWKNVRVKEKKSLIDKLFGSKKETNTELIQRIPNGVVSELPESFVVDNSDFKISISLKTEADYIVYKKQFEIKKATITIQDFEEWNMVIAKINSIYNEQIILTKS